MIVIDIETTGVDPSANSIVSVGAVEFENPSNQFYGECRARDGAKIEPDALKWNGFSLEEVTRGDKKSLEQLLTEFKVWTDRIEDRTPGGHNVAVFDIQFLRQAAVLYGIGLHFGHRSEDTHALVYADYKRRGIIPPIRLNRSDITSDHVLRYVGLPDEPKPHNALVGAKMEAEALSRLMTGRPLLEEYSTFPVPSYLKR